MVKATASLGLALILLGAMSWIWSDKARSLNLPTQNHTFEVGGVLVNWTQVIAFALGVAATVVTALTCATRRPARRCAPWPTIARSRRRWACRCGASRRSRGCSRGCCPAPAGLLLANLIGLDAATLTFLFISSLAATLIARLQSIMVTFIAAIVSAWSTR